MKIPKSPTPAVPSQIKLPDMKQFTGSDFSRYPLCGERGLLSWLHTTALQLAALVWGVGHKASQWRTTVKQRTVRSHYPQTRQHESPEVGWRLTHIHTARISLSSWTGWLLRDHQNPPPSPTPPTLTQCAQTRVQIGGRDDTGGISWQGAGVSTNHTLVLLRPQPQPH